jgi:hypothetical protein
MSEKNNMLDVLRNFFGTYFHSIVFSIPKIFTGTDGVRYAESILTKDQTQNLFVNNNFHRVTPSFLVRGFHKKLNLDFSNYVFRIKDDVILKLFGDLSSSLLYDYAADSLITVKDFYSILRTYSLVYRTPSVVDLNLDKIMVSQIKSMEEKLKERTNVLTLNLDDSATISPKVEFIKDLKGFITALYNQTLDISSGITYVKDDNITTTGSASETDLLNFIIIKINNSVK